MRKTKILVALILELAAEVKRTRFVHAVLIAIVACAFVSSIGFTLLSNVIQRIRVALSEITVGRDKLEYRFAPNSGVRGDPIGDPKPNVR